MYKRQALNNKPGVSTLTRKRVLVRSVKAVFAFYPVCTQVAVTRTDKMLSLPVHLNIITLSGGKVLKAVIFLTLKIRHVYIVIPVSYTHLDVYKRQCCNRKHLTLSHISANLTVCCRPVSYTHLDVYKRQVCDCPYGIVCHIQFKLQCISGF